MLIPGASHSGYNINKNRGGTDYHRIEGLHPLPHPSHSFHLFAPLGYAPAHGAENGSERWTLISSNSSSTRMLTCGRNFAKRESSPASLVFRRIPNWFVLRVPPRSTAHSISHEGESAGGVIGNYETLTSTSVDHRRSLVLKKRIQTASTLFSRNRNRSIPHKGGELRRFSYLKFAATTSTLWSTINSMKFLHTPINTRLRWNQHSWRPLLE